MINKVTLFSFFALSLTACSPSWETTNLDSASKKQKVNQVAASEIELSSAAFDPATHIKLGDLEVTISKTTVFNADPTVEQVEGKLREDAAKLGATAVVAAKISAVQPTALSWGARTGSGIAVKPK